MVRPIQRAATLRQESNYPSQHRRWRAAWQSAAFRWCRYGPPGRLVRRQPPSLLRQNHRPMTRWARYRPPTPGSCSGPKGHLPTPGSPATSNASWSPCLPTQQTGCRPANGSRAFFTRARSTSTPTSRLRKTTTMRATGAARPSSRTSSLSPTSSASTTG